MTAERDTYTGDDLQQIEFGILNQRLLKALNAKAVERGYERALPDAFLGEYLGGNTADMLYPVITVAHHSSFKRYRLWVLVAKDFEASGLVVAELDVDADDFKAIPNMRAALPVGLIAQMEEFGLSEFHKSFEKQN